MQVNSATGLTQSIQSGFDSYVSPGFPVGDGKYISVQLKTDETANFAAKVKFKGSIDNVNYSFIKNSSGVVIECSLTAADNVFTLVNAGVHSIMVCGSANSASSTGKKLTAIYVAYT